MGEHAMSIAPGDVMHVAVIGATGALGRHVVPRLLERGHHVRTLVRRVEQGERLRRTGASPVLGDIFNPESLLEVTRNCQAVLHLATAIPADGSDWTLNDRIRREGTRNVIGAALQNRVGRYVQQSITFLYGEQSEPVADETTPLRPDRVTQSAADMEALVRAAGLDWCILRGGWFYGPGTRREERWWQLARSGELRTPGDGSDRISLVHVVDMARAVVLGVEQAPARSIYNVVDDEPVDYRTLYGYIAAYAGGPEPQPGGESFLPSLACSNARIKQDLSWHPVYATFRSGLA
jgi:nucleoside-diphosphate-sugar epimerase